MWPLFVQTESIILAMTTSGESAILMMTGPEISEEVERIFMTEGLRVLVADDQPRARQSLKALLATWPLVKSVTEAASGKQALALAQECPPDVILMDIRMPEMDGLEATRQIKARQPQIKIIMLSAYPDHMAEALAAGADAFVCRYEPPEELFKAIERVKQLQAQAPP
jgi:CheY-like chemotaxis protein